ncbi:MAG: helix-turn-helix domain-containing protein [Clostridia bacterium]|nr:helix-turn-helix domain-containing protein [Clostridia bacterium]
MKPIVTEAERFYTENPCLTDFHMHTHETYEIYFFLSGKAKYFVEGTVYSLKPGDLLLIKKGEAHTLLIQNSTPYRRMVIHFGLSALRGEEGEKLVRFLEERPLGKENRYSAAVFQTGRWEYYTEKVCTAASLVEKGLYLTVLLWELYHARHRIRDESAVYDNTAEIILYLNEHLTEPLSLDEICARFYVSKAQLNRKFKSVTGSTVWEYIKTKRLILAKGMLQSGIRPTVAAMKSGFQEYSAFFYAYKAKFSLSPKEEYRLGEGGASSK